MHDWINHINNFTKRNGHHLSSVIEFGLGNGTEFWINNFERVTSVELMLKGITDDQYLRAAMQRYVKFRNWNVRSYWLPEKFVELERIMRATYPPIAGKPGERECHITDPAIDEGYTQIIADCFKGVKYDVAFVDPGTHFRGELVNGLFSYVDFIFAHDTNVRHIYGWNLIKIPEGWDTQHFSNTDLGTTLWHRKK